MSFEKIQDVCHGGHIGNCNETISSIRESPPQFENPIMAQVFVRSITPSTMYQKVPFC